MNVCFSERVTRGHVILFVLHRLRSLRRWIQQGRDLPGRARGSLFLFLVLGAVRRPSFGLLEVLRRVGVA